MRPVPPPSIWNAGSLALGWPLLHGPSLIMTAQVRHRPLQYCRALSPPHPIQPEHLCMASCGWLALDTLSCLPHKAGELLGQGLGLTGSQALYRQIRTGPCQEMSASSVVWNSLPLVPMECFQNPEVKEGELQGMVGQALK